MDVIVITLAFDTGRALARGGALLVALGGLTAFVRAGRRTARRPVIVTGAAPAPPPDIADELDDGDRADWLRSDQPWPHQAPSR